MKSLKSAGLRAALIAAAALLTANAVVQAQEKQPILIGGTLGLTGFLSEGSADYKAVYDRWNDEVNKRGGLLGRPVKLVIYNDESTPAVAQSLYSRLLDQDKVDLLLAPFSTFVGGAVLPIVQSHNKLFFNGGFVSMAMFTNAKGSMIGTYMYQEPDYPRGLFEFIKSLPADKRPKRAAIFTYQSPFPIVVRDGYNGYGGALRFVKEAGIELVVNEQFPANTTDFNALVQKAKGANADMVLHIGQLNDSLQVARTIQQQDYKPAFFCTCGSPVTSIAAWAKLGAAAERAFSGTPAWPTQKHPGLVELSEFFKKERKQDTLPAYAIVAQTILQVIEQAVNGAGTLDQEKLREYIYKSEFKTASGNIRFQENGTPVYSQLLLQFQNGKNEVVFPAKDKTADAILP
ncbi:MAG: amino acid ABC transporter substrate-binding protein [Bradyrhizobiaceae bacterium]|nr:amino acid ABC transporter substrate-binding protein [Bradyrhizobiaceae bacterium]